MRYFTAFLLLFAFSIALPACAQKATTTKVKTKNVSRKAARTAAAQAPAAGRPEPVLTFARTPCFGTCPAYTMEVFADGRVLYEGRHAVPMMGKKELRLPAAAVADMLRNAKEADFASFNARYSNGATDLPSTVLGVRQPDGKLKTVSVESAVPENVKMLFLVIGPQFDKLAQLPEASDK